MNGFLRLILLLSAGLTLVDDPCPIQLPPSAEPVPTVARANLPQNLATYVAKMVPKDHHVSGVWTAPFRGTAFTFVDLTNCCDGPAFEWQHRMVVIEEDKGGIRSYPVLNQDGSASMTVDFGAAYRKGPKLFVLSKYFSKSLCIYGVIRKAHGTYVFVRKP